MQRVIITKQGDPNEGREGLADVITSEYYSTATAGIAVYFDGGPGFTIYGFNEIKTVGNVTVYEATRLAFNQQRDIFSVLDLVRSVRRITGREYLMDGTILRRLRELREDGKVTYTIFDNATGKYKKNA
jgi:hypothetical protein